MILKRLRLYKLRQQGVVSVTDRLGLWTFGTRVYGLALIGFGFPGPAREIQPQTVS
jgi:hypothetical protein